MALNLLGSKVACEDCLNHWVKVKKNWLPEHIPDLRGQPIHGLIGLMDKNANAEDVCKGCGKPLGDDRMIGGDGLVGCDHLEWRWHDACFYGRFGYID